MTVVALWALAAHAERPLPYCEALAAAAARHPAVIAAELAVDRTASAELGAWGAFDPLLVALGSYRYVAFDEVRDALPLAGHDRGWDVASQVTGLTPIGTSYALSAGVGFDRSTAAGLQPRYDPDGAQVGTAPFEATTLAYRATVQITVAQQLLRGARLSYNLQAVRIARQGQTMAALTAEQTRQQALADAARAYWTWAGQVRIHAIDEDAVRVAEEEVRLAELQVAARRLAPIELSRLQAALVLARSAAVDSAALGRQARDQLLVWMGEAPPQDVAPASDPGEPPAGELDPERVVAAALAGNPELAVARAGAEAARIGVAAARHARLPELQAVGSVGRVTGNQLGVGDAVVGLLGDAGQPTLTVGGVFAVPLGRRGSAGALAAAEVDLRAAERSIEAVERDVRAQVGAQLAAFEAARARVSLAAAAVRFAEDTLAMTEALVLAERALPKDVLEARTQLDRARVEAVVARTDWRLAHTELLRLQGRLTEAMP